MLVSIIIPIYNVEAYIERCLLSVFNQTYEHIEIILIDDCSPDASIDIAKDLILKYDDKNQVKIIEHETNGGLSAARNTGIKHSKGDYLYFLDSDDYILDKCIEELVSKLSMRKYDMVVGNVEIIGQFGDIALPTIEYLLTNHEILDSFLNSQFYVMAWNKLVKTSFLIENNLYFKEGIFHEDLLWSLEVAMKIGTIYFCNSKTYFYCIRGNSIVGSFNQKNLNDLIKIIEIMYSYRFIIKSPNFIPFLESLKYSILLRIDKKRNWIDAHRRLKLIAPVQMSQFFSSSVKTQIQMLLFMLPTKVSFMIISLKKR